MISKILQILGLQPRSLKHFFLTVGQNNFGKKIPLHIIYHTEKLSFKIKVGENKLTRLLQSCRCPAQRSNERDLSEALECRRRNSNNLPITWFWGRNRVIYSRVLTTKPLEDRDLEITLPIAKILSVKNAWAWVSMVSYLKK